MACRECGMAFFYKYNSGGRMDQIDNIRERLRENRNYHAVGGRYSIEQRRALLRQ